MGDMRFDQLMGWHRPDFVHDEMNNETLKKYEQTISDDAYFDFIRESKNGGFFYGKSLHIYGYSNAVDFHNIDSINRTLTAEFKDIVSGLFSFGQDIFGHQFAFDISKKKIVFFNIETETEKL